MIKTGHPRVISSFLKRRPCFVPGFEMQLSRKSCFRTLARPSRTRACCASNPSSPARDNLPPFSNQRKTERNFYFQIINIIFNQ